jgi:antitoxin component YwqK of YwqJK toxin-antitoxin module
MNIQPKNNIFSPLMRACPYIFLLLISFFRNAAQTFEMAGSDTINKVTAEGKKQGKWINYGRHKPGACYKPDQKAEEGLYADNRKTGIWMEYYCNGNVKSKITFVNGRPDGYAWMYHENGKICEEGNWKNSRWVGNYKLYYENGQVQHEFAFNASGKRDGPQKYFFDNGQVAIEGNFANGKEDGLIREYYENGDVKAEKNFAGGEVDAANIREYQPKKPILPKAEKAPPLKIAEDEKPNEAEKPESKGPMVLNGQHTLYNRNKQISKQGLFKDNTFIEGKAYIYNENGILARIAVYRNGLYIGDAQPEN